MVAQTTAEWEEATNFAAACSGIEEQEKDVRFGTFNTSIAYDVGQKIRELIQKEQPDASALISIRTWDGAILYQVAYGNGVNANNEDWVRRKCNTVREYKKSSFLVGRNLVSKGKDINSLGQGFAAHGGAFPIRLQNGYEDPIGAIVVSGLKQWQDHDFVIRACLSILT